MGLDGIGERSPTKTNVFVHTDRLPNGTTTPPGRTPYYRCTEGVGDGGIDQDRFGFKVIVFIEQAAPPRHYGMSMGRDPLFLLP